jgi:PAS domain S-box-containing protein
MTLPQDPDSRSLLQQEPFRRIYETNLVGLSLSDLDGSFIHANDEALRIIGYERSELEAGKISWRALTPVEHLPKDLKAVREMHEVGHCTPFEKEYMRKDGTRVPVLVAFSIVKGDLAFGTIIELTTQKEMLEQQSAPGRSPLSASVLEAAHDSNNHLSVILMNAELALARTGDDRVKDHLTQILRRAERLKEINQALASAHKAAKARR